MQDKVLAKFKKRGHEEPTFELVKAGLLNSQTLDSLHLLARRDRHDPDHSGQTSPVLVPYNNASLQVLRLAIETAHVMEAQREIFYEVVHPDERKKPGMKVCTLGNRVYKDETENDRLVASELLELWGKQHGPKHLGVTAVTAERSSVLSLLLNADDDLPRYGHLVVPKQPRTGDTHVFEVWWADGNMDFETWKKVPWRTAMVAVALQWRTSLGTLLLDAASAKDLLIRELRSSIQRTDE
eukprot:GHVU01096794.1.p2 GENE.GHVU01096794.1~~GHVU01096794.1.p2  ORF type:complete len:240 (-),score=23.77 GHVU01096794.1:17-736(-)